MKKENFITALSNLLPECTEEASEIWAKFAVENVEQDQLVDFAESNPNGKEAAVEDWLDSIYAGIHLIKQRFGSEIAMQIVRLSEISCCLYPDELYEAAIYFADGGRPARIPDIMAEGSLDLASEAEWPLFTKISMLSDRPDIVSIAIADYIVRVGTTNTFEGNWILSSDEIAKHFGMERRAVDDMNDSILLNVLEREEVADATLTNDDEFDVCYFLNFCPNHDDSDHDSDEKAADKISLA